MLGCKQPDLHSAGKAEEEYRIGKLEWRVRFGSRLRLRTNANPTFEAITLFMFYLHHHVNKNNKLQLCTTQQYTSKYNKVVK